MAFLAKPKIIGSTVNVHTNLDGSMHLRRMFRALFNGLVRRQPYARFVLAEECCKWICPEIQFSEWGRTFSEDPEFAASTRRFDKSGRSRSLDRRFALDQLAELVRQIPGESAECGVYKGASSFLLCRRLRGLGKRHLIFDSFAGLSEPNENDGAYWTKGDLCAAESLVRQNLQEFDFVEYYAGWIPTRFAEVASRHFAFVHVDVDLEQPTRDCLEFFYPRLSPGGILLCDDYGFSTCPGARSAMNRFFEHRPESIVHLPTGQAFIIKSFPEMALSKSVARAA